MNDLSVYIAALLRQHDCVIVPELGGFVSYHVPARRINEEQLFCPPSRTIGFNPLLTLNDGLLAQMFMQTYGVSFGEAGRMVSHRVKRMKQTLREEGRVELAGIGEMRYDIHGKYDFTPCDGQIAAPGLYALDSLYLRKWRDMETVAPPAQTTAAQEKPSSDERKRDNKPKVIHVNFQRMAACAAGVAAAAAVLFLLLFFATPIDGSQPLNDSQASLAPTELAALNQIGSVYAGEGKTAPTTASNSGNNNLSADGSRDSHATAESAGKSLKSPAAAADEKAEKAAALYHVIIASVGSEKAALKMAEELVAGGHEQAKAIISDGRFRVSINSFDTEAKAYLAIRHMQSEGAHEQAWVLKR